MKVLIINVVCGIRSTGRICTDLAIEYDHQGDEVKIAYGREFVPEKFQKYAVRIGNNHEIAANAIKARLFDNEGFNAKLATKKFLDWASEYNPDLLWLNNLHGYYINLNQLFDWIKSRPNMHVKWLLHDCWAFTGHCTHFDLIGCEKWKTQCTNCSQKRSYPTSWLIDNSYSNYKNKEKLFTGVKNMTLVTPSQWLADLVKQSFLKEYPIEIRHNKIDTNIFKPTHSNFRKKYDLVNKTIILGVASSWDKSKGLEDFVKLSQMLDSSYAIVLVGITEKQIKYMPKNVICLSEGNELKKISKKARNYCLKSKSTSNSSKSNIYVIYRTNNAYELAEIYTASDIFLNLTYQDNYPTVNLEAQACGIPCITYRTGGSVESVPPENVVDQGDLKMVIKLIECNTKKLEKNKRIQDVNSNE